MCVQAPPNNYNTSDWDEVTNNETDNVVQSEDERPQIEEQTTPPAKDEEHESEASEVNFDSEDDLGDLLPTTQGRVDTCLLYVHMSSDGLLINI